jgi:exoribonuclease R
MRSLRDTTHALDAGLAQIRHQYQVPAEFPDAVLQAAADAARREPAAHVDRTDVPFVTLDPEASTDLDQAFTIARDRTTDELLLQYAIADVAWFVRDGDVVDTEAWQRGMTLYLPDGKAGLYPPVLAEAAASLLPDGPRPAVVFHVRLASDGIATLDGAERAIVRTRAKLAYDRVTEADLPDGFAEFGRRMEAAEVARGAAPVDPPEQVVERNTHGYRLTFRPRLASETGNAALSLATNMAVADAMQRAHTGLFRVMPEPDDRAIGRLRHTAHAFGLAWPAGAPLEAYVRTLDANDPAHAAFLLAVRRAGGGAEYVQYTDGVVPWHSAVAATYAHATAPLRRLADRYVVQTVLAVANGHDVPAVVAERLAQLPATMARAASRSAQLERSVIDLAEAVMLSGREGQTFAAVVVEDDDEISKIQLADMAVVVKVKAKGLRPGDDCRVKLVSADTTRREVRFERVA